MIALADLLERLARTPGEDARIALLVRYFAATADPDRGLGLAAAIGALKLAKVKPALIRSLAAGRLDGKLFALSLAFVGDPIETAALVWRAPPSNAAPPRLAEIVAALDAATQEDVPRIVAGWLDACTAPVSFALLRLITGGLRQPIPARLAHQALAAFSGGRAAAAEIAEVWHGLACPYAALFAWLEGRTPRPDTAGAPLFRPLIQPSRLDAGNLAVLDFTKIRASPQWDGVRVELVATAAGRRLYTDDAEDISACFPELLAGLDFTGVLDATLVALGNGVPAPFAALERRLGSKHPTSRFRHDFPVEIRLHDMLFDGAEDIRSLPFDTRRARLAAWHARAMPPHMTLAPLLPVACAADLRAPPDGAAAPGIAGLLLKAADSPYDAGRSPPQWWFWPRDPRTLHAVLMYAGPAELTFGVWRDDGGLVPIGRAAPPVGDCGLDDWVRAHTRQRFGRMCEVEPSLVVEVTVAAVHPSARHKSGVSLRLPRIVRILRDRPAAAADRLDAVLRLVGS